MPFRGREFGGEYTIQVAPEDCTGCALCVMTCPAKDKTDPDHRAIVMAPQAPLRDAERRNYEFFLTLPTIDRTRFGDASGVARGAYVVVDAPDGKPDLLLLATGSEVSLCLAAHEQLTNEGIKITPGAT